MRNIFGPAMQTINISLPDPMKQYIDDLVSSGRYHSASEYVAQLIRDDEKLKTQEHLEALLIDGLNSGEAVSADAAFWQERRNTVLGRHAERGNGTVRSR